MPRPSVDLPQPDSPTRPSTSPAAMSREIPSTARTEPRPERASGLDVGLLAHADHMVPDHPEVLGDVDDGDRYRRGEDSFPHAPAEQEGDHDRKQEIWKGEKVVHDQDEHTIERSGEVA